jgi:DNA polymerase III subunit chi
MANNVNAAQTAVILQWQQDNVLQDDMLINLAQTQPLIFSRFTQLVELVGQDERDKAAGRVRFKFYRDRGYEIKHVDCAKI